MLPYQERVVLEQAQLSKKLAKLSEFNNSDAFRSLADDEQDCLIRQWIAMRDYDNVLKERIGAFTASATTDSFETFHSVPTCFHSMVDFADKFTDLVNDQSQWSQATFGSDSDRGPMGALKHLEKEALECQEAVGTPYLREELADCLLLLLDASRRAGIKPTQLVEAAQAKMVKNKQRTWPKPMSDEPVEHVR